MRGIADEQAALKKLVLQQAGIDPEQSRGFISQTGSLGMEGALLRLPATPGPQVDLQDPVTGELYYMIDMDSPFVPMRVL